MYSEYLSYKILVKRQEQNNEIKGVYLKLSISKQILRKSEETTTHLAHSTHDRNMEHMKLFLYICSHVNIAVTFVTCS